MDGALVGSGYADHLTDADLGLLAKAADQPTAQAAPDATMIARSAALRRAENEEGIEPRHHAPRRPRNPPIAGVAGVGQTA